VAGVGGTFEKYINFLEAFMKTKSAFSVMLSIMLAFSILIIGCGPVLVLGGGDSVDSVDSVDSGDSGDSDIHFNHDFNNITTTTTTSGIYYAVYTEGSDTCYPFTMSADRNNFVFNLWRSGSGASSNASTFTKQSGADANNPLIGTWLRAGGSDGLIVTSTQLTWTRPDLAYDIRYNYVVGNSIIKLSGQTYIYH
jgi:hypothetical protein